MSIHELQAALRALDEAQAAGSQRAIYEAASTVIVWARRVAEAAGEPVAWQWFDEAEDDWQPVMTEGEAEQRRMDGQRVRNLYTAPPPADALVEAVSRYFDAKEECRRADSDPHGLICSGTAAGKLFNAERALRTAIAKHKENSR